MRMPALALAALALAALLGGCRSPEERLSEHLERATKYFEEGKWNEAKIEYLNVVQLDPDHAEGHFKLAEVLWKLDNYGEARWQYKEAVRLDPANVPARLQLARIEIAVQRPKDAQEQVDAILAQEPQNVDALLLHGVLSSMEGNLEALLSDADRALAVDPKNEAALTLKARGLEAKQDPAGAEAAYRQLLEAHPNTQNMIRMALFLGTRQRSEESLEFYRKAVEAATDDKQRARARLVLANSHLNAGDSKAAEEELLRAQKEAPDDLELLLAMARFFAMRGERDRAREMLELRVNAQPGSVEPLMVLANFHRSMGDEAATLATIDRALAVDAEAEVALLLRAEILMESASKDPERGRQGRELLNRVLEKNPNSVRGMFTQAKFLLLDGKAEEAAAKLRRVVDEEPNANAYVLLGTAYAAMKETELARSEFLRAIQLDPSNVVARTQLAVLYAAKGEKDLAIQEAKAALERRPDDLALIVLLAGTLHGMQKDHEAREVLARVDVEKLKTAIPKLRLELASLHRKIGDLDRARELIEAEVAEHPDDPTLVAQLAVQDLAEKNPMGAIERLDEGIQKHPDVASLYELRARVRLGFAKDGVPLYPKEAEADLKAAIEKGGGKTIDPYVLLASMYQATNRTDEAIATYEKALETQKDSPNLWLLVGMLYEKTGRTADAIRAYEEVTRIDPKHGVAMNNLAWLLVQDGTADPRTLDRAMHLAEQAREVLPDTPSVADTLGWIMLKRNIPSAAISLFREAIDGYEPGNPLRSLIRYHLAEAYKTNGEPDRAVSELESALAESASFPDRSKAEALLRELKPS